MDITLSYLARLQANPIKITISSQIGHVTSFMDIMRPAFGRKYSYRSYILRLVVSKIMVRFDSIIIRGGGGEGASVQE